MPRRPWYALASLVAFPLLIAGCGDDPTTPDVTLAVSLTGDGAGTVTSTPAGISCSSQGGTCSADFGAGGVVSLTATPDAGDAFVGWSGGCSGSATCSVTLGSEVGVTAEFDDVSITTAQVGPAGATVLAPDGAMELVIPAGALAESVEITIEVGSPDDVAPTLADPSEIRAVYDLQPDGLEFAEPVEVRLTIPAPPSMEPLVVELPMPVVVGEDGRIDALGSLALEEGGGPDEVVLVGETGHFSRLLVTEVWRGLNGEEVLSLGAGVSENDDAVFRLLARTSARVDETFTVFPFAQISYVGEFQSAFATARSVSMAPLAVTPTGSVDLTRGTELDLAGIASYDAPFEVTCLAPAQTTFGFEFTVDLPGDGPLSVTTVTVSAPFTCVAVGSYSLDASSVDNTDGVVPPGTQVVGLLDPSGATVGLLSVEFGGDVRVDPARNVIRFGSGGRINVDLTDSSLPASAPAPDEMTVIVEGSENSETSDVGWVRRDADGTALEGNSVSIRNGTLEFAGAPMFFVDLVSGGPFDFILSLRF